ncbi:MAG: hypothetical protein SFV54_12890 [Bryobacteraceae bacterium]|nr:hypothetical protein [Bryobacteraceae bacterium]
MVTAYALFRRNAWDWNAAGGVLALAVLPSGLGFRMGWTASGVSWRAAIVAGMVVAALGLCSVAKAQTEWAGLALMLVLSWPVAHAVRVCRYRPAPSKS